MDYVLIKNIPSELWVCPLQSWFQTSLSLPAIEPPKWLMQRRDLRKNHSSALLIRFFPLCSNTAVTIERSACYLAALIGGITSLIANRFNRSITVCLWVDKTAAAHTTFSPSFGWPPRERSVVERITIKPPFNLLKCGSSETALRLLPLYNAQSGISNYFSTYFATIRSNSHSNFIS